MKNLKTFITVLISVVLLQMLTMVSFAAGNGAILPSTGGIGTTIFYILGAVLVIGAGVLLVTKKRIDDDKD